MTLRLHGSENKLTTHRIHFLMGKKLLLVRHAQTEYSDGTKQDKDRELTPRGHAEAEKLASNLRRARIFPDLIISSSAVRTSTTAEIIAERLGYPKDTILKQDDLYHATPQHLLQTITELDDKYNTVIFVNHNPGITHITEALTDMRIGVMQPSSIAFLHIAYEKWVYVTKGSAMLMDIKHPEMSII